LGAGAPGEAESSTGILPLAKSSFQPPPVPGVVEGVELLVGPVMGSDLELLRPDAREWVSPGSVWGGWSLPGHGEPYGDCGTLFKWRVKGCLHVEDHVQEVISGEKVAGKIYILLKKRTCLRAVCPVCYEKWAGKEAHKIERRLKASGVKKKPIHLIVSVPVGLWYEDARVLRKKAYEMALRCGFIGGSCIFHPFRSDKEDLGLENSPNFVGRWYVSPHFHMIGYGWIHGTAENYEVSGWVVKNAGVRKSVVATAQYQLSHAGVNGKSHTVTWFGRLSYNKLRLSREDKSEDLCPLCGAPLVWLRWVGEGEPPLPDEEGEYFVEPGGWVESCGRSWAYG